MAFKVRFSGQAQPQDYGDDDGFDRLRFLKALRAYEPSPENMRALLLDYFAVDKTIITEREPRLYQVQQILVDEGEENTWYVEGEVDARAGINRDEPLLLLLDVRG